MKATKKFMKLVSALRLGGVFSQTFSGSPEKTGVAIPLPRKLGPWQVVTVNLRSNAMKTKKLTKLASALLLGGMLSAPAFAADTVCSVIYWDGNILETVEINANNQADLGDDIPIPTTTLAVASNFYDPAIEVAEFFLKSSASGTNKSIGVCHNSTGHLVSEITGNNPPVIEGEWLSVKIDYKYGLFMAANANGPDGLPSGYKVDTPVVYANGIAAILTGSALTPSADPPWQDLLASNDLPLVEGLYYADEAQPTGKVIMNFCKLDKIAIASPSAAPYGAKAQTIITAMGQWPASTMPRPGNNPAPCTVTATSGKPGICVYDNINIAFTETLRPGSNLDAGWVAWAQIKSKYPDPSVLPPPYITFPGYAIPQKGVRLTDPEPDGADVVATAFWGFINLADPNAKGDFYAAAGNRTWNDWLEDSGYGDIPNVAILKRKLQQKPQQKLKRK
jgi:hypothetical protein